jgi:small subunit ribosomal protein S16
MLTVRLSRVGTNKAPLYRIVVANSRAARDGRHLENLGTYDPRAKEGVQGFKINHDRLAHWRGFGAQLSDEVARLLSRNPAQSKA